MAHKSNFVVKTIFETEEEAKQFSKAIEDRWLLKSTISEIKLFDWKTWGKEYFKGDIIEAPDKVHLMFMRRSKESL